MGCEHCVELGTVVSEVPLECSLHLGSDWHCDERVVYEQRSTLSGIHEVVPTLCGSIRDMSTEQMQREAHVFRWIAIGLGVIALAVLVWYAPLLWCSTSIMSAGECTAVWGGDPLGFLTQNFWARLFTGRL
jgi:hypothetical protein